ncbi:hypothetical protein AAC03nite_22680 [Alicyclobacillus acidoterrestris]|uniref:hypothetical protein n=1 Tax=Alicyclobacillus suci TaxID=2816080 RepID=UPI001190BAF1|nr:hypothetical protein [Alicyclobacillus suci]GEO26483.1 hypothetical protein AAC03nite_22680 [Alicyclobacillus acidoterrestris]
MNIKALCLSAAVVLTLGGCGQLNHLADANTAQTAGSTTLNPQVYATCKDIYTSVKTAVSQNKDTQFDDKLNKIEHIGQNSPQGTPNAVLYQDAATVVALDDAMNAEGAPARAAGDLSKALAKLKADLDKYQAG